MKPNLKDDTLTRKSPGLFALVAVLSLGISALAYDEVHQKINAGERDMTLVDRLNEVARLHVLLGQISDGHVADAKQQLKIKLAEDLGAINQLLTSASEETAGYARCVLTQMDRDQKAHPDYYLTSLPATGADKTTLVVGNGQVAAAKFVKQ